MPNLRPPRASGSPERSPIVRARTECLVRRADCAWRLAIAIGLLTFSTMTLAAEREPSSDRRVLNTPARKSSDTLPKRVPGRVAGRRPAARSSAPDRSKIVPVSGETDDNATDRDESESALQDKSDSTTPPPYGGGNPDEPLIGMEREEVVPATGEESLIDLPTALRLAEAANPTIGLGRQAIFEALALQTEARAMLLPSLNAGTNYHLHQGKLQTSFGDVRSLNEQSIYFGGGARTLAAETVAIPAVRIFSQLGDAFFAPLSAGQVVSSRTSESHAIVNTVLLDVVYRYLELVAAEATLDALHQSEDDLRQIVLATAAFAKAGQGRIGDFNRARTRALLLHSREQQAQEKVAVAAAKLSRVLHLDPSLRLKTRAGAIEVVQLVDPDYTVEQLIQIAEVARPELAARAADIAASDYRLRQEYMRPWLPTLSIGVSGGAFGGGADPQFGVPSFFQRLGGRTDFDAIAYWTLQNMGAGNAALQKQRRAERDRAIAVRGLTINQIGREVGDAFAMSASRRGQLDLALRRLETAADGAREEITRTRGGQGFPLEAINSVELLIQAREALIQALVQYNEAQFELFVAIGQTPHVGLPDPQRGIAETTETPAVKGDAP
ncbi:MAG TPA: TolC family protein [Planctomycetaceae bacterium]|nr:TolC family protein [Planctomycetaceae bacterium]